jgi:hypothetical protein
MESSKVLAFRDALGSRFSRKGGRRTAVPEGAKALQSRSRFPEARAGSFFVAFDNSQRFRALCIVAFLSAAGCGGSGAPARAPGGAAPLSPNLIERRRASDMTMTSGTPPTPVPTSSPIPTKIIGNGFTIPIVGISNVSGSVSFPLNTGEGFITYFSTSGQGGAPNPLGEPAPLSRLGNLGTSTVFQVTYSVDLLNDFNNFPSATASVVTASTNLSNRATWEFFQSGFTDPIYVQASVGTFHHGAIQFDFTPNPPLTWLSDPQSTYYLQLVTRSTAPAVFPNAACYLQGTSGGNEASGSEFWAYGSAPDQLCIPSFGTFGGSINYPPILTGAGQPLTVSTSFVEPPAKHGPPAAVGTPILYIGFQTYYSVAFGNTVMAGGGLSASDQSWGIVPGQFYSIYLLFNGGYVGAGCATEAVASSDGLAHGVISNFGSLLENQAASSPVFGAFEVYYDGPQPPAGQPTC